MKSINQLLVAAAVLLAANGARATLDIPDGSTIGVASSITVSGLSGGAIGSSLSLQLNISGGNDGDLYAYLSYDGNLVTLLSQPGVSGGSPGFANAGYNVLVEDGAGSSLNTASVGSPVTGTYYAADGSSAFTTAFGSDINDGNGTWTLFIADLSGGDSSDSQLNSWFLTINGTTVPEPITWGLIIFAGGALSLTLGRRLLKRTA